MKTKFRAALAFGLLLSGCGPYYTPMPTARAVKPSDLVGRWRYETEAGVGVDLTLMSDATFTQAARLGGRAVTHKGWWRLAGSDLELSRALTTSAKGEPKFGDWRVWIVDEQAPSASQPFVLFGADDWGSGTGADPDSGHYFARLP